MDVLLLDTAIGVEEAIDINDMADVDSVKEL